MLTEFGGIALLARTRGDLGLLARRRRAEDFAARYAALLEVVRSLPLLAGFCYTQFADTYQEANGLLYADRTPKFPLDEIAAATRGPRRAEPDGGRSTPCAGSVGRVEDERRAMYKRALDQAGRPRS